MPYQPIEVKLVENVRTCRTCKWFWGATPPYGNFPVFDWNEDFPEKIRNQKQTTEKYVSKPGVIGKACGQGQIDPGIMHGCRKAPIMTVGINPNMTSYFISQSGARWSYPNFSKDARYAYYYRHHNVYQESLDIEFIKKNVVAGTEIIAKKDGWLLAANRSSDHRWVLLTIQYEGEEQPVEIEVAWKDDLRFVVVLNRSYSITPGDPGFKKGDLIGGKISNLEEEEVQIFENSTGYYQRYVHVLDKFKETIGGVLKNAPLSISEDVAQHDMIGCASPGWSSVYDIPTEKITKNCVIDHAWLLAQLIQTKPSVIVVVGGSSLAMFARIFGPFLNDLEYEYDEIDKNGEKRKVIKETYQLLKETTEREHFLYIKVGAYELKSRIVISPHFSYDDNFVTQARFSAGAWEAFEKDFASDAQIIKDENRLRPNTWNNIIPIRMYGKNDSLKEKISTSGWNVLMAYYYDPVEMLTEVLQQEYKSGRIAYDTNIGRLKRTDGGCKFCVNDLWQFPEGCPYGKNKEDSPVEGELEKVVQEVIKISQKSLNE